MHARDYHSSNSHREGDNLLLQRLKIGPRHKQAIIFRSTMKNRIFVTREGFEDPVYYCHAFKSTERIFLEPFSFKDCYHVDTTFKDIVMKADDCNPTIDTSTYFAMNSSLRLVNYNVFGEYTQIDETSSNWFCKYQDEINEKDIRKRIENWLSIVADQDKNLITLDCDGFEPFQSFERPHIDIHIGYFSNRKSFTTLGYQIFKSTKLLHEGVMMNGYIFANISTDQIHLWSGTLTIVIGSQIWLNAGELYRWVNDGKFVIQTQLHKSRLHGLIRVWGKIPADHIDGCKRRFEPGLGLICKYANGVPNSKCWRGLLGGAWIYGELAKDGEFTGKDIVYINQDMSVGFKGTFHRGLMMNASVVSITGERCNKDGMKILEFVNSTSYLGITFRFKRPNLDSMGDQPFVLDPLDNKYINVGQSSIDTDEMSQEFKENGAFAKEDIPPQTVISHNNGYIVNQKERHEWINKQMEILKSTKDGDRDSIYLENEFNEDYTDFKEGAQKYRTSLHCNEFLEIPSYTGQLKSQYRSTWGHKINHCFKRQNSRLQFYDSAQFGVVMAIKTLDNISISKGQEIFLHYGYSYSAGPKWYKDSFINILKQQMEYGTQEDTHWEKMRNNVFSEANVSTVTDSSNAILNKLLTLYRNFAENRT